MYLTNFSLRQESRPNGQTQNAKLNHVEKLTIPFIGRRISNEIFADSTRVPRFKFAEMQNHTVRVGSEATFACIVEQLGTSKVFICQFYTHFQTHFHTLILTIDISRAF